MDGQSLRQVVLEVVAEFSQQGTSFQANSVLQEAARKLGIWNNVAHEQALLTFWYDLFRTGYLAWGYNLSNPEPPFCHLTDQGRLALAHLSRDPINPAGYLEYLRKRVSLPAIADSYIQEALNTFNAACFKAAAVMVGVASEDLILAIRAVLVGRMDALGQSKPADLTHWIISKVLDAIEELLTPRKGTMPPELAEAFEAYWPAFTHQIRTVRNDAGHPKSVDPVSEERVHAALLNFPEIADLASKLERWIASSYS